MLRAIGGVTVVPAGIDPTQSVEMRIKFHTNCVETRTLEASQDALKDMMSVFINAQKGLWAFREPDIHFRPLLRYITIEVAMFAKIIIPPSQPLRRQESSSDSLYED